MSLCNRRYSATQYALFTSLNFFTGAIVGSLTGFIVARIGYGPFFAWTVAAAIPGVVLLIVMPRFERVRAAQDATSRGAS
jgi:PAT family beta-lactamase induction signal transducer AmpG